MKVEHPAFEVHGVGGLRKLFGATVLRQKPQNVSVWLPEGAAVFDAVPVVSANGIGSAPMKVEASGGQSCDTGYAAPRLLLPGMQARPLFAPPMQQTPPVQLPPDRQTGQGWMPGRVAIESPVRYRSELRLKLIAAAPAHVPEPDALVTMRLMTHVLVAELLAFGTGSGGPKRQPSWKALHSPTPQSAFVRHGWPLNMGSPVQAGYSGFGSVPEVQVRMLPVWARLVAVRL